VMSFNITSNCTLPPPSPPTSPTNNAYTNPDGTWTAIWFVDQNNGTITVNYMAKTPSWAGFAFDLDGLMPDSDSAVAWIDPSTGEPTINDRYTTLRAQPLTDIELGGTDDLRNTSVAYVTIGSDQWLNVTFTKKLVTGDKYDVALTQSQAIYLLWSIGPEGGVDYSSGIFYEHDTKGSASVNFFGGCPPPPGQDILRKTHACLMIFGWTILLYTGIFIARYLKAASLKWFPIHVSLQSIGAATILTAFTIIFIFNNGVFFVNWHEMFGLFVFIGTMAQPFLGLIADRLFDPKRTTVPCQDKIHWWVGRTLVLLVPVTIFLGIWTLIPTSSTLPLYIIFGAWVGLQIVIIIVQEIRGGQVEEHEAYELNEYGKGKIKNKILRTQGGKSLMTFAVWFPLQISLISALIGLIIITPTGPGAGITLPPGC